MINYMIALRDPDQQAHPYSQTKSTDTLQPLYNTVHYNTVLDITQFNDGSQKYIDYIEK